MVMLEGYRVSKTQQLEDLSSGLSGALGATASQVWVENPSSSATRLMELDRAMRSDKERSFSQGGLLAGVGFAGGKPAKDVPDSPIVTKDDADRRVSEAGVPLTIGDQGIPEDALNILISRKRDELKRKAIMDSAPAGFWNGAAKIGVGLAVSIADPINVASAFVPVVGQARYAKLVAGASSAAGRASVRAGVGVTEGVVGAALVEPLVLIAAEAEQADYGLYDSFLNLAFGAVLGGGLHSGLGAVGDAIGRSTPQTKETMLKGAIGQAMDDRPIDLGYLAQTDKSFQKQFSDSDALIEPDADLALNRKTVDDLPEFQQDAVSDYATGGSIRINQGLRSGELGPIRSEVEAMDFAIEDSAIPSNVKLFRKIDAEGVKGLESNQAGQVFKDPAFLSTTTDRGIIDIFADSLTGKKVFKQPVIFEINAAKGKPGLPLPGAEKEVILPRNSELRAISDETIDGVRTIKAEYGNFTEEPGANSLKASAPKRNAPSKEASSADSFDAEQRLAEAPADLDASVVDTSTDDILTALDDLGDDTVAVRAEIDEINQSAEREGNGLREATMCLLGR